VGGIVGGAILLILVYSWFFFISPGVEKSRRDRDQLVETVRKNRAKLDTYKRYLSDEATRRTVEERFTIVASRLPSNLDPIEVFDILRGYFEGTDVQFTNLDPGPVTNRGRYTEQPFKIRGTARYHEFGQLVNLIECDPKRLMRVNELRLTNNERRPSIHPMELTISTFTFNQ
jgi:Tfp pilus assembly protein PilO